MVKIRGGMEFRSGAVVRLGPVPATVPAQRLRLTAPARPDLTIGQTVEAGQILFQPDDPARSCITSPIAGGHHSLDSQPDAAG